MSRWRWRSVLLVLVWALESGCPGQLEHPERFLDASIDCTADFVENDLFLKSCASSTCHTAAEPAGNLDLESAGVLDRLKGPSSCSGHPLSTFMLEKLDPSPPCSGAQMPIGKPLSDAQRECLRSYLSVLVDAGVDAGVNQPPEVADIAAPMTAFAGQVLTLSIAATDADRDPLTFYWSQTAPLAAGTFAAKTGASVSWYSPMVQKRTAFSFAVVVSDGKSTPVTRSVTVNVEPAKLSDLYTAFIGPVCTGCHGGSGELTFGASASLAWGNLVDAGHHQGDDCRDAGARAIVVPGDPAHSLLYFKVLGAAGGLPDTGQCGAQMPRELVPLPNNQKIMLESWIRAGALDD